MSSSFTICNRCGVVPAAHHCARQLDPDPTPTRPDIDTTGRRLETVSNKLETLPDPTWASNHWRQVRNNLSRQWRYQIACHDIPYMRH